MAEGGGWAAWGMALRPRTLSLSVAPVLAGTALAWSEGTPPCGGGMAVALAGTALAGAALIQMGTNLYNDARDFERGGDGPDRIGPRRAAASGLLSPARLKAGAGLCGILAGLAGLLLVWAGGWPILLLGLASLLAGWGYTGGPRPIAYTPLGEAVVVAFFGLGAVQGSYWLLRPHLAAAPLWTGLALGALAAAVLLVNNHRDRLADARAGRRTLAILAGPRGSVGLYGLLLLTPFLLLFLLPGRAWIAAAALPPALRLIGRFRRARDGALNPLLGATARLQLLFALLLSAGVLL